MKILNRDGTINKRILNLIDQFQLEDIFKSSILTDEDKECYLTDSTNDRLTIKFNHEKYEMYFIFIIESDQLIFEEEFNMDIGNVADISTLRELEELIIKTQLEIINAD